MSDDRDLAQPAYRFEYSELGVYGAVMSLIAEHVTPDGVHLDLGCGFGALAEKVRGLGLTYVGMDLDEEGLTDLQGRGFQVGTLDLQDVPGAIAALEKVLDGRRLASISLLDTLEHVTTGAELLASLRELAGPTGAPLVVSVPNISHRDIALKLMTGRFDYTSTGLLDRTHLVHHTAGLLSAYMVGAGWREVGSADFELDRSDQAFPADHVALATGSLLRGFLAALRARSAPHDITNQFVRAYLPGAARPTLTVVSQDDGEPVPFLSVVVRTQGRRPAQLRDTLLCLQAQTDADFELLVMVHLANPDDRAVVVDIVEELPMRLRHRLRVVDVPTGGRARPLNQAVEASAGRYVAFLDDDDLVFAHWVSTFRETSDDHPGSLLRSVSVLQQASLVAATGGSGPAGVQSTGSFQTPYPTDFDLFAHLEHNRTPFMAWAFPRSLFRDMGLRFDESLDICEDWDFALRAALLVGVTDSRETTSVYRRWSSGESSYSLHTSDEWRRAEATIIAGLDAQTHLFPAGTIGRVRRSADPEEFRRLQEHAVWLQTVVDRYETSRSWRLTKPLRALQRLAARLKA